MKEHLSHIAHCSFRCNHFNEMVAFYRDVLELEEVFTLPYHKEILDACQRSEPEHVEGRNVGDPWITYFRIYDEEFVELFNMGYDILPEDQTVSFRHLAFSVKDIAETAKTLHRKGIPLRGEGSRFLEEDPIKLQAQLEQVSLCGSLSIEIDDPEGNVVEFMQYTSKSLQIKDSN